MPTFDRNGLIDAADALIVETTGLRRRRRRSMRLMPPSLTHNRTAALAATIALIDRLR